MPVEMWEIPEALTAGPGYESTPQPRDGYEETFGSGPSWKPNACSDVVLRGLDYKECSDPAGLEKATKTMSQEKRYAAWIGVDWADEKHAVCEYAVATASRRGYTIEQRSDIPRQFRFCDVQRHTIDHTPSSSPSARERDRLSSSSLRSCFGR